MGCGASKKKEQQELLPRKKTTFEDHGQGYSPEPAFNANGQLNANPDQGQQDEEAGAFDRGKTSKKQKTINNVGSDTEYNFPPTKKTLKELVDVSNLNDLPEYKADNPKFKFRDGELSPIGSSNKPNVQAGFTQKVGSQQINSFEQEVVKNFGAKKIRVKRQKTSLFNWPPEGEVEIKTISYKVIYDYEEKGFRTIKSKDNYLSSVLLWKKDEEEDLYECRIKDTASTVLRTGNYTELSTPHLTFHVDTDGKFIEVINLEKFTEAVLALQNIGKVTKSKQDQLNKTILNETEKLWNSIVQEWVFLNKQENAHMILNRSLQYGKDCLLAAKASLRDDDEFRDKLKQKLLDPKGYYQILSSSKMIKDKCKKWELHKDSTAKPRKVDENGNTVLPHRNLRLNFIYTDKNEASTALIEATTVRPMITNYENSKKIIFEVNRDIYIDVEYEAKMSVFLWKDATELRNDEFLINEMVRFQDSCKQALADLLQDLSALPKVPLKYRLELTPEQKKELTLRQKEKGIVGSEQDISGNSD